MAHHPPYPRPVSNRDLARSRKYYAHAAYENSAGGPPEARFSDAHPKPKLAEAEIDEIYDDRKYEDHPRFAR